MKKAYLLENEKISKAILILGIPTILTSMARVLYNIIDTIFIGQFVGPIGISALGIYLPIQMFVSSLTVLFATGTASLLSRTLGKKDYERANEITSNLLAVVTVIAIIISLLGVIFTKQIVIIFGAKGSVLPYAISFTRIMFIGFLFSPFISALNNIIRAEGNTKYNMNGVLISLVVNIILDYVFIVILKLGVPGSALATVFANLSNLLYIAYYFKFKSFVKIKFKYFKINFPLFKEILPIGFASFSNKVAASLGVLILNHALYFFGGNDAIAIYSVVFRLTSFIQLSASGLAKGAQPLIGYNYGAKNIKRMKEALNTSLIIGTSLVFILTSAMFIFSKYFIEIFSKNSAFVDNALIVLRIAILASPLLAIYFISMGFYRAIGKAREAFFLSLFRRIIFFIPLIVLLPFIGHLNLLGIWIALPLSDLLSASFAFLLLINYLKKHISNRVEVQT